MNKKLNKVLSVMLAVVLLGTTISSDVLTAVAVEATETTETTETTESVEITEDDKQTEETSEETTEESEEESEEEETSDDADSEDTEDTEDSEEEEDSEDSEDSEDEDEDEDDTKSDDSKSTESDKEDEEDDEDDDEVEYPAVDFDAVTISGTVITVCAPEGALPEGTSLSIHKVSASTVIDEVNEETDTDLEESDLLAFDISFTYKGEEIEPETEVEVTFADIDLDGDTLQVFHMDENADGEIVDATAVTDEVENDGSVTVEADEFSIYVVVGGDHWATTGTEISKDKIIVLTYNTNGNYYQGSTKYSALYKNIKVTFTAEEMTKIQNKQYEGEATYTWDSTELNVEDYTPCVYYGSDRSTDYYTPVTKFTIYANKNEANKHIVRAWYSDSNHIDYNDADADRQVVWVPKAVTITFNANNTNGKVSTSSITVDKNSTVDLTKYTATSTDSSMTFAGWGESADATSKVTSYKASGEKTFYAQWNYKVSYDSNGGTGSQADDTKEFDKTLTLPTTTTFTAPEGATFAGWSTEKNNSNTKVTEISDNKAVKLYAIWTYEIKFDSNGGEGTQASMTKYQGEDLILPGGDNVKFAYSGRAFLGWALDKSATEYVSTATEDKNATYYAIWSDYNKDANAGVYLTKREYTHAKLEDRKAGNGSTGEDTKYYWTIGTAKVSSYLTANYDQYTGDDLATYLDIDYSELENNFDIDGDYIVSKEAKDGIIFKALKSTIKPYVFKDTNKKENYHVDCDADWECYYQVTLNYVDGVSETKELSESSTLNLPINTNKKLDGNVVTGKTENRIVAWVDSDGHRYTGTLDGSELTKGITLTAVWASPVYLYIIKNGASQTNYSAKEWIGYYEDGTELGTACEKLVNEKIAANTEGLVVDPNVYSNGVWSNGNESNQPQNRVYTGSELAAMGDAVDFSTRVISGYTNLYAFAYEQVDVKYYLTDADKTNNKTYATGKALKGIKFTNTAAAPTITGYTFNYWTADGKSNYFDESGVSAATVDGAVSLVANATAKTTAIKISNGGNGTVTLKDLENATFSADGTYNYTYDTVAGNKLSVKVEAAEGYELDTVKVNGETVSFDDTTSLDNITLDLSAAPEEASIQVSFKQSINASADTIKLYYAVNGSGDIYTYNISDITSYTAFTSNVADVTYAVDGNAKFSSADFGTKTVSVIASKAGYVTQTFDVTVEIGEYDGLSKVVATATPDTDWVNAKNGANGVTLAATGYKLLTANSSSNYTINDNINVKSEGETEVTYYVGLENTTVSYLADTLTFLTKTSHNYTVKIDTVAPEVDTNKGFFTTVFNAVNSIFRKESITIGLSATDATPGSGVDHVEYIISKEQVTSESTGWTSVGVTGTVTISEANKDYLFVRAIDKAGNVSAVYNSEGIVIYKDSENLKTEQTYTRTTDATVTYSLDLNGNTVNTVAIDGKTLSESDYTVDNEKGTITIANSALVNLAAGDYDVTVTVNPAGMTYVSGSNSQVPADLTAKLTVVKAENTIKVEGATTATYPEAATATATQTGNGTLTVTSSDESVAKVSIDENGVITITPGTTAGEATITVTSDETDDYQAATTTFTVKVENGTFTATAENVTATYDNPVESYSINVVSELKDATITYSTDGENYTSENPAYTEVGTYTTFYKAERAGYVTVTGSATVTIEAKTVNVTVDAGDNGTVTTTDANLTAGDAEGSYTYSYSSVDDENTVTFTVAAATGYEIDTITVGGEAVAVTAGTRQLDLVVSLQNAADTEVVVTFADKTAPVADIAIDSDSIIGRAYTLFFKDSALISVTAEDDGSGIDYIEYTLSDSIPGDDAEWTTVGITGLITLSTTDLTQLYVRAYDKSGNVSDIYNTNGIVVYTDSTSDDAAEYTRTSTDDVTVALSLNDNTVNTVTISGGSTTIVLTEDDYTVADGTLTIANSVVSQLSADEDYTITVTVNPQGETYTDGDYNEAPATVTVPLTVNRAEGAITVGDVADATFPIPGTVTVSALGDADLTVTSSDTSVATVSVADGTITVTPVSVNGGTITVTVTSAQTDDYTAAETTFTFTVNAETADNTDDTTTTTTTTTAADEDSSDDAGTTDTTSTTATTATATTNPVAPAAAAQVAAPAAAANRAAAANAGGAAANAAIADNTVEIDDAQTPAAVVENEQAAEPQAEIIPDQETPESIVDVICYLHWLILAMVGIFAIYSTGMGLHRKKLINDYEKDER